MSRRITIAAGAIPLLVFLAVYTPAVGLGFISDDYRWVRESHVTHISDVGRLFRQDNGFYRPLVSLTFAANRAIGGIDPRPYGLTNLGLALACAALLALLCRRLGLTAAAAAFAALVWLLNFHGINMALLWISGRTALVLIIAALGAANAVVSRKTLLAGLLVLCALFAKEEAVLLPFTLIAWSLILGHHRDGGWRHVTILVMLFACDLIAYFWLRSGTHAMTPATAPAFYHLTLSPAALVRNLAEYADRSLTFAVAVTLLGILILKRTGSRLRVPLTTLWLAASWYIGGCAITTLVPSRSSLYACLPSIAAAIVCAEICGMLWRQASHTRQRLALAAVAVVPILCLPAYVARNHRWTDLARFSTTVTDYLAPHVVTLPPDSWIVLVDEDGVRVNLRSAFGDLLPDAFALSANHAIRVWVESAQGPLGESVPPCAECQSKRFVVRDRQIYVAPQ